MLVNQTNNGRGEKKKSTRPFYQKTELCVFFFKKLTPSMALVTHEGQVAGHGDLLSDKNGKVYKCAVDLEAAFYVNLSSLNHQLQPFVPAFYGLMRRPGQKTDTLILEDLLHEVEHASVLDVKLGRITVLPDMPEEKRILSAAKDKSSTTSQLSLRITGFRSWRSPTNSYVKLGKDYGKKLSSSTLPDGFRSFFDDGVSLRTDVLDVAIPRLAALETIFEKSEQLKAYKFVSSSILIVYGQRHGKLHVDVRMIDFAHTLPPGDERVTVAQVDYLAGLKNLLATLRLIRSTPEQRCVSGDGAESPSPS